MAQPSRVNHRVRNMRQIAREADPNWDRDNRKHVEYEFSNGRKFEASDTNRGPYAPEEEE